MTAVEKIKTTSKVLGDGKVFGKYSMGAGINLPNPDKLYDRIDTLEIIESYEKSMKYDIRRAGISMEAFKNYEVMDVGTGRQAIAFHLLGAKKVHRYDISPANVERMREFIAESALQGRVSTECCDLVDYQLPTDKFDFVYLHGIVQHFSNVGIGLRNCMKSVKKGGLL